MGEYDYKEMKLTVDKLFAEMAEEYGLTLQQTIQMRKLLSLAETAGRKREIESLQKELER